MNVVFIGDITGPEGVALVAGRLPAIRRERAVDLVIANADNVAITGPHPRNGFGLAPDAIQRLLSSGVDVLTTGTHAWDGPHAESCLSHPLVLRPDNATDALPGRGRLDLDVDGSPATVLVLAATELMPESSPAYQHWLATSRPETTLIHHVGDPWRTRLFAAAIDGEAAAVLGTLGHEATRHVYLLPGGTALVPDVGMVGPLSAAGAGHDLRHFVEEFKGNDSSALGPFSVGGPAVFEAVWLRTEGGKTVEIERIDEP